MRDLDWDGLPPRLEVRSGGVTLAAREIGPAGAPRALALHGGPGLDHHLILPLAARVPGLRWLVPDLPAHGGSPFPSAPTVTLRWLEERLEKWVAHLDSPPEVVLAHSFGAWLAKDLVRRRAITPRALILVAPLVARGGETSRAARSIPLPAGGDRAPLDAVREHVRSECRSVPEELDQAARRASLRHVRDYGPLIRGLARALERPARGIPPPTRLLVICGSDDRTTPVPEAVTLVTLTEGARLEVLEDAGHWAWAEQPDRVASLIETFLNGEPEAGTAQTRIARK